MRRSLLCFAFVAIGCTGGGDGGTGGASSGVTSSSGTSSSTSSTTSSASSGGSVEVTDTGYSHDCAVDEDCVPVYFGDVCAFCSPSNAVISKSAEPSYQTAVNAARARCPPRQGEGKCAPANAVTKCAAKSDPKKCVFVTCDVTPSGPHSCGDGGT